MGDLTNQGAATSAPTFDAAAWFASWCEHGGIAVLIGDAVWIGRTAALDMAATQRLNQLREPTARPEAQSALAGLLLAHAAQAEQMMEG